MDFTLPPCGLGWATVFLRRQAKPSELPSTLAVSSADRYRVIIDAVKPINFQPDAIPKI